MKWRCFPTQWFFISFTSILPQYHIKKYVDILGGRTYPVRYYPIALRLRDREGRAFLCITLNPQSGESSGVMLGVRSVALLHLYLTSLSANNLHEVTIYLRNVLTSKNIFYSAKEYWVYKKYSNSIVRVLLTVGNDSIMTRHYFELINPYFEWAMDEGCHNILHHCRQLPLVGKSAVMVF